VEETRYEGLTRRSLHDLEKKPSLLFRFRALAAWVSLPLLCAPSPTCLAPAISRSNDDHCLALAAFCRWLDGPQAIESASLLMSEGTGATLQPNTASLSRQAMNWFGFQ
jgi:hypothetical protein